MGHKTKTKRHEIGRGVWWDWEEGKWRWRDEGDQPVLYAHRKLSMGKLIFKTH